MWGNSIARRVQKAIKQRVVDAQAEHDAAETQMRKDIEAAIDAHAEAMVDKIIGQR